MASSIAWPPLEADLARPRTTRCRRSAAGRSPRSAASGRGAVGRGRAAAEGWAIAEAIAGRLWLRLAGRAIADRDGSEMTADGQPRDDVRLRRPFRQRGGAGRAAPGPQFAAAARLRPLCRAAVRHRLHRAARREPALLALPDAAQRRAPALSALSRARRCSRRARPTRRCRPTGCAGTRSPCPARPTDFVDGLVTMMANRDPADLEGVAVHIYRANRRHGGPLFLRRRRRAADHPRAGPARPPHRAGPDRDRRPARSP